FRVGPRSTRLSPGPPTPGTSPSGLRCRTASRSWWSGPGRGCVSAGRRGTRGPTPPAGPAPRGVDRPERATAVGWDHAGNHPTRSPGLPLWGLDEWSSFQGEEVQLRPVGHEDPTDQGGGPPHPRGGDHTSQTHRPRPPPFTPYTENRERL